MTDEGDVGMFRRALVELVRLHEAAGASEIITSRRASRRLEARRGPRCVRPRDPRLLAATPTSTRFSAHQMGSCRMGADPATSVANPWGELHDTRGVWIGDASAFPTASGTNPMITIMALARRTAQAMA